MYRRTMSRLAPLCLGAALTVVTGDFCFPGIWVSAEEGIAGENTTACTAEREEIALDAVLNDPLTFSCPAESTLKPEGATNTSAPTACTEALCSTETALSALGITATLSSAAGKRETGQPSSYAFRVTGLPPAEKTLYYICQIPASGSPAPDPAPPEPPKQKIDQADKGDPAATKDCRVKIVVPANQPPAPSTPAPPASSTQAPPATSTPAPSSSAPCPSIRASIGALCLSLGAILTGGAA